MWLVWWVCLCGGLGGSVGVGEGGGAEGNDDVHSYLHEEAVSLSDVLGW